MQTFIKTLIILKANVLRLL